LTFSDKKVRLNIKENEELEPERGSYYRDRTAGNRAKMAQKIYYTQQEKSIK